SPRSVTPPADRATAGGAGRPTKGDQGGRAPRTHSRHPRHHGRLSCATADTRPDPDAGFPDARMAFLSLVSCVIARPILMTDLTWPDLIRPEPPTTSTRRLLVVDFDFFFPNPLDAGAADTRSLRLYDWGHAETVIHREVIWPVRAAAFAAEGLRLPRCQPTTGFW